MKNSIKVFILLALAIVPAAVSAQVSAKHAITTKGAGSGDKLAPCPVADQADVAAAQARQKTKTKSNNANDRTTSKSTLLSWGALMLPGCAETAPVDPGLPISFKVKDTPPYPSLDQDCVIKIWQLRTGQTAADGLTQENLVLEKTVPAGVGFLDLDAPPRRPHDVSTSFVWEIRAMKAGKAEGTPHKGSYDLATAKKT